MYGQLLRLPGQFLSRRPSEREDEAVYFAQRLREEFEELRPTEVRRHGERQSFVFKDLHTVGHVFMRRDGPKAMLEPPYEGPFPVVRRQDKVFVVLMHGEEKVIRVDRLKPAFIFLEDNNSSGDHGHTNRETETHVKDTTNDERPESLPAPKNTRETRSGRKVRFPDRFQAGL